VNVRRIEQCERPEPSGVWLAAAFACLSCAAAVVIAVLTLAPDAPVRSSELLIVAVSLIVIAVLCFLAHWDSNRGRRPRRYEVKDVAEDD